MKKQVAGADVVHAGGGEIAADDAALFAVDVDAGVIGPAGVEAAGHDGGGLDTGERGGGAGVPGKREPFADGCARSPD